MEYPATSPFAPTVACVAGADASDDPTYDVAGWAGEQESHPRACGCATHAASNVSHDNNMVHSLWRERQKPEQNASVWNGHPNLLAKEQ